LIIQSYQAVAVPWSNSPRPSQPAVAAAPVDTVSLGEPSLLADFLARVKRAVQQRDMAAMADRAIDQKYEAFQIPKWEETGITDQSTTEDMTSVQFREFKKVEKFAHRVMKEGRAKQPPRPDLSKLGSDEERLKAIIAYETTKSVGEKYKKAIKSGVMGALDSGIPAGERYERARMLSDALNASQAHAKEVSHGLIARFLEDREKLFASYQQ